MVRFQLTRPRGARLDRPLIVDGFASFNSRAREGRDTLSSMLSPLTPCFNSRAREGRDWLHAAPLGEVVVSTHAPARGATERGGEFFFPRYGFNSRAREGRDRAILQALSANVKSLVFRERQPERGAMRNI